MVRRRPLRIVPLKVAYPCHFALGVTPVTHA
jgi:hypothetical protein